MAKQSLYHRLARHNIPVEHVAEVGVYHPKTSNVYEFIVRGTRATLVEPDPEAVALIQKEFRRFKNVTLHPVALYDRKGEARLIPKASSSFLNFLETTPAMVNDGFSPDDTEGIPVKTVTFDEIDDGQIDVLSIDVEGAEWFVLKHAISRPKVISVETHGGMYVNPYLEEILDWMRQNGYTIWYKTDSDTVFVKEGTVRVSLLDRLKLLFKEMVLSLKRHRKRLKHRIKTLWTP